MIEKHILDEIIPDKQGFLKEHVESIVKASGGNLNIALQKCYKIHDREDETRALVANEIIKLIKGTSD